MAKLTGNNIPIGQIKCFVITGRLRNGRRFKSFAVNSYIQAMMYNLWCGNVWAKLENGKRIRIKQVIN